MTVIRNGSQRWFLTAASRPLGNFSEMRNIGLHPRPNESERFLFQHLALQVILMQAKVWELLTSNVEWITARRCSLGRILANQAIWPYLTSACTVKDWFSNLAARWSPWEALKKTLMVWFHPRDSDFTDTKVWPGHQEFDKIPRWFSFNSETHWFKSFIPLKMQMS